VIGNNRRSNQLDGHNIRYGGASASGTDTSAILVAEYLANNGHEVVFASENSSGNIVNNVHYTDLMFTSVEEKTFDILVSMLWVDNYDKLPITVTKSVVYWSHMQWFYGVNALEKYCVDNNLKMGVVHISEWEKKHTSSTIQYLKDKYVVVEELIPNPIAIDVVDEVRKLNIEKRKEKIVFHAAWARGGRITYDVVDALNWKDKELHVFDYLMNIVVNWGHKNIVDENPEFLKKHGGADKYTIFQHLAESKYFVYPLYTPYQDVHKDTFSCVVAEAVAMGCIVLTYPLGAVPEYFSPYCYWIPVPEGFNVDAMQNEPLTKDLEGKFTNATPFIEAIEHLENNIEEQERIRNSGYEHIRNNFSIDVVGMKWKTLIETFYE
jgi:glycosyltransferase involved in cell wall biosynthesis